MPRPKKALGFWILTALVTGNMIGAGIFLLPSALGQYGSVGILGWIVSSFGAICLALMFAKLGSVYPRVGGPYAYCREGFGDFIGFSVAYTRWTSMWTGNTAMVVMLVGYLGFFLPILTTNPWVSFMTGVIIIWIVTTINIVGIRQAGIVQLVMTILKLIPLFSIICVGLFFIHPHYLTTFNVSQYPTLSALNKTAMLTFWSFFGMDAATIPADDVENPIRNIPGATIAGMLIATFVYILSIIVIMGVMPMKTLAESASPFADAAHILFGSWGGSFIALGAIISAYGALNGGLLTQGQLPRAAAQDKLFPKLFAKMSKRGIPIFSILFSGILMTMLLAFQFNAGLVSAFTFIVSLAVFTALISYLYTSMAEIIILIRRKERSLEKNIIRSVIIAILSFIYIFWITIGAGEKNVFYGILLFFLGTPIYVWIKWRQKNRA